MPSALLFDLDDTLCRYRRPPAELLPASFDAAGVEPCFDVDDYVARFDEHLEDASSKEELRRRCFRELAAEAGRDPAVGERVAAHYADARDHSNVTLVDGAREALETLSARYPLAVVTNGSPDMQDPKLDALDLWEYFETVVYAGHDLPAKPAVEPFEVALDALGVPASEAAHVGDGLETDVAGATAAGLEAIWFAPDREGVDGVAPVPDRHVRSLVEVA